VLRECMTAARGKAQRVQAAVGGSLSPRRFFGELSRVYGECLIHLTGDDDRDLVSITHSVGHDANTGDYWAEYNGIGTDALSTKRLYIGLILAAASNAKVEVQLVATKGDLEADLDTVPSRGSDSRVGNSVLVARALHLTTAVAAQCGVLAITNFPLNPRLAALYSTMGFVNGTFLDLNDVASLERTFDYALQCYAARPSVALAHP
jgi:hypothetical protein